MKSLLIKHNNTVFFAFLVILVLAVYQRSLFVYFLSDDFSIIGRFLEHQGLYFSFADFFRPLPLIDLWLDTQFFGLNPTLFRLSNLAIHSLNAFLVYRFALLLLENNTLVDKQNLAYLGGILFAILPCHSEAVIWISCRPDLLATLFSLICLICYLTWLRSANNIYLFISSPSFLLAFLSKESAYALPLLLVVITIFHESPLTAIKGIKKYRLALLLFISGLLLQFVLRFLATRSLLGGEKNLINPDSSYLYNLFVYSYRGFLFPSGTNLNALTIINQSALISLITLFVIAVGLWAADKHLRKVIIFTLSAFIVALLPVLHKTLSLFEVQMERYLYLPSVFICIFIPVFVSVIPFKKIRYLIFIVYISAMTLFLNASIERWNKASDIVVNSLRELKENFHSQKLMVIGLPDTYKGVPVFRNGFPRAVMLFNPIEIRRKYIYMPVMLAVNDDNIKINLQRNATGFQSTLDSASSVLLAGSDIGAYDLVKNQENDISIHYSDINNSDYQVMVFENGQLRFSEP